MNEAEKRQILPEKYHPLINPNLSVQSNPDKKEISFFFVDFEQYRQFLVLYEADDFKDLNLVILSSGDCQKCGQHEFLDSHEFVLINSLRAKIAEALQLKMLVHLCPECLDKVAEGKEQMILRLIMDMNKIKKDPKIPDDKKTKLIEAIENFIVDC